MPISNADADPAPDQLADDHDQAAWDRDKHGRMADHATTDDTVTTRPWHPEPEQ